MAFLDNTAAHALVKKGAARSAVPSAAATVKRSAGPSATATVAKRVSKAANPGHSHTAQPISPSSKRQKKDPNEITEYHFEVLELEKEKNLIQIENAKLQTEVLILQKEVLHLQKDVLMSGLHPVSFHNEN